MGQYSNTLEFKKVPVPECTKVYIDLTNLGKPEVVFEGPWNGLLFGAALRVIKKGWLRRKSNFLRDSIKARQDEQKEGKGDAKR